MEVVLTILQVVVALGIYNVWLIRPNKMTSDRGKNSQNIKEEFKVYGLPTYAFYVIGFLKISLATIMLAGIWIPGITSFSALGLAILMAGAISMHIKVRDPLKKSLPAIAMFVMSVIIVVLS